VSIHLRSAIRLILAVVIATLSVTSCSTAPGNTLRIDPSGQTLGKGSEFSVRVVENATVDSSGAQASVTFDRNKAEITSVTWGSTYAAAPIHIPSDLTAAISKANTTGKLAQLAAAVVTPDSVAPGDADFLTINFTATGCGSFPLDLPVGRLDAALLDGRTATYGDAMLVTTAGGTVTIDCSAPAGPVKNAPGPFGGLWPWLPLLALAVVVIAISAGLLLRRSRRASQTITAPEPRARRSRR
jgi:hypothetical protein